MHKVLITPTAMSRLACLPPLSAHLNRGWTLVTQHHQVSFSASPLRLSLVPYPALATSRADAIGIITSNIARAPAAQIFHASKHITGTRQGDFDSLNQYGDNYTSNIRRHNHRCFIDRFWSDVCERAELSQPEYLQGLLGERYVRPDGS